VNVGDTVRFEGRCVAVEARRVRVAVKAVNQHGEDVLKSAQAEAVVEEDRP
jgi:acyl dehydratase